MTDLKKRLIEKPNESEVRSIYSQLISELRNDDVLYNDTLAICLKRLRVYQDELVEVDIIFDSVLTFINTNYNPLLNSIQNLVNKLSSFKHDVQKWIDIVMSQPKTKNIFVLLGVLLKKGNLDKYPNYAKECYELLDESVANAMCKTLVHYFKDDWREFVNRGLKEKNFLITTHLLPGLIKKNPKIFDMIVNDNKDPLILVSLLNLGKVSIDLKPCLVHYSAQVRLDSLKYVLDNKLYDLLDDYVIEVNLNEGDDKFVSLMSRQYEPEFASRLRKILYDHIKSENNFQQKLSSILILHYVFDERAGPLLVDNLFSNYKAIRDASLNLLQKLNYFQDISEKCFKIITRLEGRESEGAVTGILYMSKYIDLSDRLKQGLNEDRIHGYLMALAQLPDPTLLSRALEISVKYTEILSRDQVAYRDEEEFKQNKEVINYAWKVLQSANELMLRIAENFGNAKPVFLQLQNQLRTLKFRGAISSTYPFYERACKLYKGDIDTELDYIQESGRLISRRSGGIIYIIPGILQFDDRIDYTIEKLLEIAQKPVSNDFVTEDLPQIHAFNILKQIFTEKNLTNASSKYLERGLKLSLDYFESPVWSIRNCAMMLFGSLKKKIFNSKIAYKRFFARFKLKQFFIEKLFNEQCVMPILIILESLEHFEPDLASVLEKLLRSKIWKIRELSGRILAKMINCENLHTPDENSLQGKLFALLASGNKQFVLENPQLLYSSYFIADIYVKILTKTNVKIDVIEYFYELLTEYSIYNGKKKFAETLFVYILKYTSEIIPNVLNSKYENLYPIALDYIDKNMQFDLSPYLDYPNAISVYSKMDQVKKLNIADIEYRANFYSITKEVLELTKSAQSLETRVKAFNALYIYLDRATGDEYDLSVMLLFERGLFDDDEDIRIAATKKLCQIYNLEVSTTYLAYKFPTLFKNKPIIHDVLMRNTLDYEELDRNLQISLQPSLYSFERDNFYKNEVQYTKILQRFNTSTPEFKQKVLKDLDYISKIPNYDHLPLEYIMLDFKAKTKINATIAGIN